MQLLREAPTFNGCFRDPKRTCGGGWPGAAAFEPRQLFQWSSNTGLDPSRDDQATQLLKPQSLHSP